MASHPAPGNDTGGDRKFRGNWCPVIDSPSFNAFSFLPVPPPQPPRNKAVPVAAPAPDLERERLAGPPSGVDVLCTILDRYNDYRGYISKEGECVNCLGETIGYINAESMQAGSADENFLGELLEGGSNRPQILDASDEIGGTVDLGTHAIQDSVGSTVADLDSRGMITGHNGTFLGQFEGFSFHIMREIAIYLVLVDPGMLSAEEGL